jgi:hypothetical protein
VNQVSGVTSSDGEYGKAVFDVEMEAELENPDGEVNIGGVSVVVCCDCDEEND